MDGRLSMVIQICISDKNFEIKLSALLKKKRILKMRPTIPGLCGLEQAICMFPEHWLSFI